LRTQLRTSNLKLQTFYLLISPVIIYRQQAKFLVYTLAAQSIIMKHFLLLLLFAAVSTSLSAQDLYMPRDIRYSFKNQTRSADGKPGKNYWQNKASYNITISAMPPDRNINGNEQISYTNNSPDTLHVLTFKFIQNIHRPGVTRQGGASADYLTDGVHVDKFTVNGIDTKWEDNDYSPTCKTIAATWICSINFRMAFQGIPQEREGGHDRFNYLFPGIFLSTRCGV
jgi:hypothetical protein